MGVGVGREKGPELAPMPGDQFTQQVEPGRRFGWPAEDAMPAEGETGGDPAATPPSEKPLGYPGRGVRRGGRKGQLPPASPAAAAGKEPHAEPPGGTAGPPGPFPGSAVKRRRTSAEAHRLLCGP